MRNINEFWDFPVVDGADFENANRIHPLMQKRIQMILNTLIRDKNLKRLILFGSSLEFRCSSYSDIDLLAETYDHEQRLADIPDVGCDIDIITNLAHTSRLYREIDETGLLLFER